MGVDTGDMRITIRVRPGSARPGVGGEHDGALVVRVSARAVDGKATEAALAAVAGSFGVRRSAVRLVSGASSRTKIVDIDADDPSVLASLLAAPNRLRPRRDAAVANHERSHHRVGQYIAPVTDDAPFRPYRSRLIDLSLLVP